VKFWPKFKWPQKLGGDGEIFGAVIKATDDALPTHPTQTPFAFASFN